MCIKTKNVYYSYIKTKNILYFILLFLNYVTAKEHQRQNCNS